MTIIRAQRWKDGKPVGAYVEVEPVPSSPETMLQKGANALEHGLDRIARSRLGCSDCQKTRANAAEFAKTQLRKVIPKK